MKHTISHVDLLADLTWVQRLAHRMCSDSALAEDLSQEAAAALMTAGAPPEGAQRRPWLAGVVRNLLRDRARRDGRRRGREEDVARREAVEASQADLIARAETQRVVTEAVMALREPYRTAILQRYFDGWTPSEIAERTDTSVATVRSRLSRGRALLEEDLRSRLGEDARTGWFSALMPLALMGSQRKAPAVKVSGLAAGAAGTLKLVALIAAIALAMVFLRRAWTGGAQSALPDEETVARLDPGDSSSEDPARAEHVEAGRTEIPSRTDVPMGKGAASTPARRVVGRALDHRGQALASARAELFAGDDEDRGSVLASAAADAQGRFEIEVPVDTGEDPVLVISGGPFDHPAELAFGSFRGRRELPLGSGTRDLGAVVLDAAGAVRGTVVDRSSGPVAGAVVTSGLRRTLSGPDGRFELGGLYPGSTEITAQRADIEGTSDVNVWPGTVKDLGSLALTMPRSVAPKKDWGEAQEAPDEPRAGAPGSLTLTVLHDGEPVHGALVELERGAIMGKAMKELLGPGGKDFAAVERTAVVRSAPRGGVRFDGLVPGDYRVRILPRGGAALVLEPFELKAGAAVNLGEVEVPASARATGVVLVPPGVVPAGLVVTAGSGASKVHGVVSPEGRFELGPLAPGEHDVELEARPGEIDFGVEAKVTVAVGAPGYVELDATSAGLTRVSLDLDLGERAPEEVRVVLFTVGAQPEWVAFLSPDSRGQIDQAAPAAGPVQAFVEVGTGPALPLPNALFDLRIGVPVVSSLRARFGGAEFPLGVGRDLPTNGMVEVILFLPDGSRVADTTLFIEEGAVDDPDEEWALLPSASSGSMQLQLRDLALGSYLVSVSVDDDEAETSEVWVKKRAIIVR